MVRSSTDSLTGLELLDALVDQYAAEGSVQMMDKSVALAALSQQLALQMTKDWPASLTSIIDNSVEQGTFQNPLRNSTWIILIGRKVFFYKKNVNFFFSPSYIGDPDAVVKALDWIVADQPIVQLIDNSFDAALNEIRRFVEENGYKDATTMFFQFRSCNPSSQRILKLLKLVEELNCSSEVTIRIKYHLGNILLIFLSKQIVGEEEKKLGQCQALLSDSLYFYIGENGGPSAAKIVPFFSKLQQTIEKLDAKSKDQQEIVMQFIMKQLGLDNINEKKISGQQVLFVLRHLPDVNAEQLDKFLNWSVINGDTNLAQLAQQIFQERYWEPGWKNISSNVKEERTREELQLIRQCLEWEHCHLPSYHQKMTTVSQLEEKLLTLDSKQFSEWIQQQITQLRGFHFVKKADFLDFFRHQLSEQPGNVNSRGKWETVKGKAKGIKDAVISTVTGQQQPVLTEFDLKIRGALNSYHQMTFELKEIQELSQILNQLLDVDPKNQLQDLIKLKDQHQRHWPTNYLRSWFETKQSGDKELVSAVESLF